MLDLLLPVPDPFDFGDVVLSHGWLRLPPFAWDDARRLLARTERLPDGQVVRLEMSGEPGGVRLRAAAAPSAAGVLVDRARWMLGLEQDLSGFHRLCAGEPGLRAAGARGAGRMLRSPTVWEDLVKTLLTVNTTWSQTIGMTRRLVTLCHGEEEKEAGPFPEPAAVAALDPALLRERCRVGYRAGALHALARAAAGGSLDLESLRDPLRPDREAAESLLRLPGIGPYAAAHILLLLGRWDHLPVDSWFRRTVREAWFDGQAVPDRELAAAFERFRPYRALAYVFYDWEGAMRREVWS